MQRLGEIAYELGIDGIGGISTKYDFAGRLIAAATHTQKAELVAMALGESTVRRLRSPNLTSEEDELRALCLGSANRNTEHDEPSAKPQQSESHSENGLTEIIALLSGLISALEKEVGTHIEGGARQVVQRIRTTGTLLLGNIEPNLLPEWHSLARQTTGENARLEELKEALPKSQVLVELKDRLALLETAKVHASDKKSRQPQPSTPMPTKNKKLVFIVYGRNTKAYDALVVFLRSLGLDVKAFGQIASELGGSPYVGDIIQHGMKQAQAVIVLFTPDEISVLKKTFIGPKDSKDDKAGEQPRPNVIFEAGLAMAIDRTHTIVARMGKVRPFSDISGVHFVDLNNSQEARSHLRDKLIGTGCDVNLATNEWLSVNRAGDFEACVRQSKPAAKKKAKPAKS